MPSITVNVRILSEKRDCNITMDSSGVVAQLKAEVDSTLGVSKNRQKLIFNGKTLADDKTLASQGLIDGSRVHLIVQQMDADLAKSLHLFLRPHFTEPDCKLIIQQFDKKLSDFIEVISLEDIERLATSWRK